MQEFFPYITNDGSVGLYSPNFNDIYHSATGAYTEAFEKFVYPYDIKFLFGKKQINVLDICYGIGYNTKAFLQKLITEISNETIYINNLSEPQDILSVNNVSIHDDNILLDYSNKTKIYPKINIVAVDTNRLLGAISPFIITDSKLTDKTRLNFQYEKINKYLSPEYKLPSKSLCPEIPILLLASLLDEHNGLMYDKEFIDFVCSEKYTSFFNPQIVAIFKCLIEDNGNLYNNSYYLPILHNIYYNHISNSHKSGLKYPILDDVNFSIKFEDARKFLKQSNMKFDLIFLDAFTPSKCPCLWSYDFFKLLYSKLNTDGLLLTYSNSASVRNAMMNAGFSIGKIFNLRLNKFMGTIGVKNSSLIKYPLTEFELGLLKTRAGIFYRDENLTGQNEAIMTAYNKEVENSNLMSSSRYMKLNKATNHKYY